MIRTQNSDHGLWLRLLARRLLLVALVLEARHTKPRPRRSSSQARARTRETAASPRLCPDRLTRPRCSSFARIPRFSICLDIFLKTLAVANVFLLQQVSNLK